MNHKLSRFRLALYIIVFFWIFIILSSSKVLSFIIPLAVGLGIWYLLINPKGKKRMATNFNTIDADQVGEHVGKFFGSVTKFTGVTIVLIIGLIALIKAVTIIPAGSTGVYHLFGRVSDNELPSGFHLVNPFANVTQMSVRTEEYTMSVAYGEGNRPQADAITALTKEGLNVDLDITVFYHLMEESASDVYKNLGTTYAEKIIRPEIRSAIREVIAQYEAKAIYSEKREEAAFEILEVLKTNLEPRGIETEQVLMRNVVLPAKLADSIQEKLTAEQEAERMTFVLDKEKKEAERKIIEAQGQRDAQQIINQSLSDKYLEYLYINSLKDREGTIYVPVSPDNGLPLFRNVP